MWLLSEIHGKNGVSPPGLVWTICAAALKGSLLSAGVRVRNSGGCIANQKARNERYPSKKVLNLSNVESRNRGGLMKFPHSFGLHGARCHSSQAQILKGAEEGEVEWNVVWTATMAIRPRMLWANSAMGERLRPGRTLHMLSGSERASSTT